MTDQEKKNGPKITLRIAALIILLIIGLIDYIGGPDMSFSVFYLLPVFVAVWFVGTDYGVLISILSVASWLAGDLLSGMKFQHGVIVGWNAIIVLFFYLVFVWLIGSLRDTNRRLEAKVVQRTEALTAEIAERERLEKEILEISEREQRRIGYDLHDSICQHLTGTAIAGQVLAEKLSAKNAPEAADARNVVALTEEGITLARNLARGLQPVEIESLGFIAALEELSHTIRERFKVQSEFICDESTNVNDISTATHLYRIAQEAAANAIKHGKAKRIVLELERFDKDIVLRIKDNGIGLPEVDVNGKGMGLRIMKHRASMIGGSFSIQRGLDGGTVAQCSFRNTGTIEESSTE